MANPATNEDFMIGTTLESMVTLASLGIPNPHPIYGQGVQSIKLGNNSARTIGAPVLIWAWGFITQAQRDTLRTYITGASAALYIRSVTTEVVDDEPNGAQDFLAQSWWPSPNTPEDPQTGRRLEFQIIHRQLVVQT